MQRLAVILALAASLLALAAPAAAAPKPETTAAQLMRYDFGGAWGKSWDLLHPGQQRFVERAKFIACQKAVAALAGYRLLAVTAVGSENEALHVAGVPQRKGVAVTLHLSVRTALGTTNGFDQITHLVWTGTRWTWFLGADDVAAYRAGHCP